METREFGKTGHKSTVGIFGGFALGSLNQEQADQTMETIISAGINHIDIAPSYGDAEARLAPWMIRERERFFLGCKTMERTSRGAENELHTSLSKLNVDSFDLYQIHAITNREELDQATKKGGALEAMIAAKQSGIIKNIGITGHGMDSPDLFIDALSRFDFDSILFPVNFILYANPRYKEKAQELIELCHQKNVGIMTIKAIAKKLWGDQKKTYNTWYTPFSEMGEIQQAVNFALSQNITGICTAGDATLLPLILEACENYTPMSIIQQATLIRSAAHFESIFS